MRRILAIGGGTDFERPECWPVHRHVLSFSAKPRPRIVLIPTASAENPDGIDKWVEGYSALGAEPRVLSLFDLPSNDLAGWLAEADLIFVGGGNTKSMLALWREWGLDEALERVYHAGMPLAGVSAGANCWFEQCSTDSYHGALRVLPGLGWLTGSFCPHLDSEPERRAALIEFMESREMGAGYACTDGAALEYVDEQLVRAVSWLPDAAAYRVEKQAETQFVPLDLAPIQSA